jgi:hypothetical protein
VISNQPSVISELKARGNRQQAKERIWQFSYLGFAAKSFSVGVGGWGLGVGGWGMGFTDFQVVNYLNFPPDHSHAWYFLIDKKSKSLTQQGF